MQRNQQQLHGCSLIAGVPASPKAGVNEFTAVDPARGEPQATVFFEAADDQLEQAAEAAAEAQNLLSRTEPKTRAALLRAVAEGLEQLGDVLIERCMAETALPEARLHNERARTVKQLRMFADLLEEGSWVDARIDRGLPNRTPAPKPDIRRLLLPIGPVAVFGASNFPLAFSVAGGDTAAALAAGNPVIVKAHPSHPGTSELVGEVICAAVAQLGLPGGVFSLLHGPGTHIGATLVRHPAIQAVAFTGSLRAGRALFDIAAARPEPIPVFAEMGSTNPVFVLPGALRTRGSEIGRGLAASATLGIGQFCTQPGVAFVPKAPERESWIEDCARAITTQSCSAMLTQEIASAFEDTTARIEAVPGVTRIVADSPRHDSDTAQGSKPPPGAVPPGGARAFHTDLKTYLSTPVLRSEAFGPCTIFVTVESDSELLKAARSIGGQLTATIHGEAAELTEHHELCMILARSVGRVVFNGFPTGVEVCPAMQHGGPYPATTSTQFTSVGTAAILRFVRPVCFQDMPQDLLPAELRDENPRGILRQVDGVHTRAAIEPDPIERPES